MEWCAVLETKMKKPRNLSKPVRNDFEALVENACRGLSRALYPLVSRGRGIGLRETGRCTITLTLDPDQIVGRQRSIRSQYFNFSFIMASQRPIEEKTLPVVVREVIEAFDIIG